MNDREHPPHLRAVRIDAERLQRDVGLDRRAEIRGAAGVERPGPVVALVAPDMPHRPVPNGLRVQAQKAQQQDMLGGHGNVGFQLAAPPTRAILAL